MLQCTQTSVEPGGGPCWGITHSVANFFSWYKQIFSVYTNKYLHTFAKCECAKKLLKGTNIWIELSKNWYEFLSKNIHITQWYQNIFILRLIKHIHIKIWISEYFSHFDIVCWKHLLGELAKTVIESFLGGNVYLWAPT